MTAPSYGQPEPFDPSRLPTPVVRPTPRSRRLLPIAGAIVLAVVAFAGGYAIATATSPKATPVTGGGAANDGNGFGNGNGFAFGPGASGRVRNGFGGGGGASGTVGSVSADQLIVKTAAGGSRIVLLTPTTTVTEVTSATKSTADITSGSTVTVVGTSNPDGSVTATRVIIGDLAGLGRGPGGFGGAAAPSPSSAP